MRADIASTKMLNEIRAARAILGHFVVAHREPCSQRAVGELPEWRVAPCIACALVGHRIGACGRRKPHA